MTPTDTAPLALRALAAAVYLAIGVLAARRAVDVPLARPLGVFTLGLFAYSMVEMLSPGDGHPWLNAAENAIASLILIPAVELLLGFAGRRREFRAVRIASALVFALLALTCFLPLLVPDARWWTPRHWELGTAIGIALFFGLCAVVLVGHFRRSGPVERTRTLLLLGALLLGGVGAASTLLGPSLGTPNLLDVGMMSTGVLLALLFFRTKLLAGTTNLAFVTSLVFGALVVLGELLLLPLAGQATALFVGGTVVLVLFAFAALRPVFGMAAEERARAEHLATLGRLSLQMAHDLKNPLQALLTDTEYLEEERRLEHGFEEQGPVLEDMVGSIKRMERLIEHYRRLSSVEPRPETIDLDELLTRVVARQSRSAPEGVTLEAVATDVGPVDADADLLVTAVENLLCNAFEAMSAKGALPDSSGEVDAPVSGAVRVSAHRRGAEVHIRIADQGPGMDARRLEQARKLFFTTKATGTGLGLSYAGRVAEAHGGELRIESAEGEGATVTLVIAAHTPAAS